MRQIPPGREDDQGSMRRRISGSKQQEGAERDEETEKHRIRFIVHHDEPLRVPKIGVEELDKSGEQESQ